MSAFTDSMLEAGFDDPSSYLDYLEGVSHQQELLEREMEYQKNMPSIFRVNEARLCPICGNGLKYAYLPVRNKQHDSLDYLYVRCKGFPECKYEIVLGYDYFLEKDYYKDLDILKKEIDRLTWCPVCKNVLVKIETKKNIYIKCYGFPECHFYKILEIKTEDYHRKYFVEEKFHANH